MLVSWYLSLPLFIAINVFSFISQYPFCSSYRKGSLLVTLNYGRQIYLLTTTTTTTTATTTTATTVKGTKIFSIFPSV